MKLLLKNEKGKISVKLSIKHILRNLVVIRISPLIAALSTDSDFPSSAGEMKQHLALTIQGSFETPNLLARLLESSKTGNEQQVIDIYEKFSETNATRALRTILDSHGSDKGSYHNYDLVYAHLITQNKIGIKNILEIGLGTNNTDTVSNMGVNGKPGASLRSWRDFLPDAEVIGCDIDMRILFEEERIKTLHLDQTDDSSWNSLLSSMGNTKFDLIIDDGLHAPIANLRSVIYGLNLLKEDGTLVIEDVAVQSLPIWKTTLKLIENEYSGSIVKTKRAYLILFTKK